LEKLLTVKIGVNNMFYQNNMNFSKAFTWVGVTGFLVFAGLGVTQQLLSYEMDKAKELRRLEEQRMDVTIERYTFCIKSIEDNFKEELSKCEQIVK
jgi:hypothetical protein